MEKKLDLSIIVLSYNTKDLTVACLDSVIKNTSGIAYEIIVVDNNSADGSGQALKNLAEKQSKVKLVLSQENLGYPGGNNEGIKRAHGRYILFLNSDTKIGDNVLGEMLGWMDKHPKVGIASCALKNRDGSEQGTGGYFPTLPRVFSWMTIQDLPFVDSLIKPFHPVHHKAFVKGTSFYSQAKQLDWVIGAFMLTRREVVEAVGPWDKEYFMYTEDVDYCYRAKKLGWQIWYLPNWSIIHYGGASSPIGYPIINEFKGVKLFYKKHYPGWQFPILRFILKVGALGRILLFGILEGRKAAETYVQAFRTI